MEEDQTLDLLKEKINACDNVEEKIRFVIEFMKTTLASGKTPRFREFWDAKKLALNLFQEKMNPISRANFWKEYTEMTIEAKRLKEILDEQASFAIEQIELALTSFEADLENIQSHIDRFPEIEIPDSAYTLKRQAGFYAPLQRELGFLNNMAMRLNALRKEVIKTDMRIRFKNKILQRLSALGDQIFPKRKELIKSVSETFISDVESFIAKNFEEGSESSRPPLYQLREEIKAFQEMAKVLTINTQAFQDSRKKLSACWESLRELDKERKKELVEKKEIFKENSGKIKEKIDLLVKRIEEESPTPSEIQNEVDELLLEMKEIELSKDAVKSLKDELFQIKKDQTQKKKEQQRLVEEKRFAEQEKRIETIRESLSKWENELSALKASLSAKEAIEALKEEMASLSLNRDEKGPFEALLIQYEEKMLELEERELLTSNEATESLLDALERALQKRDHAREKTKKSLESLRKEEGGSGLDLKQALKCRERIDEEKRRLSSIDQAIARIQEKINEIIE